MSIKFNFTAFAADLQTFTDLFVKLAPVIDAFVPQAAPFLMAAGAITEGVEALEPAVKVASDAPSATTVAAAVETGAEIAAQVEGVQGTPWNPLENPATSGVAPVQGT